MDSGTLSPEVQVGIDAGSNGHRAVRVATGREAFQIHSGAYTGASPALHEGNAFYGTFNNEVLALDVDVAEAVVRHCGDPVLITRPL